MPAFTNRQNISSLQIATNGTHKEVSNAYVTSGGARKEWYNRERIFILADRTTYELNLNTEKLTTLATNNGMVQLEPAYAFFAHQGTLYVMMIAGTVDDQLNNQEHPNYLSGENSRLDIYTMDPNTGLLTRILASTTANINYRGVSQGYGIFDGTSTNYSNRAEYQILNRIISGASDGTYAYISTLRNILRQGSRLAPYRPSSHILYFQFQNGVLIPGDTRTTPPHSDPRAIYGLTMTENSIYAIIDELAGSGFRFLLYRRERVPPYTPNDPTIRYDPLEGQLEARYTGIPFDIGGTHTHSLATLANNTVIGLQGTNRVVDINPISNIATERFVLDTELPAHAAIAVLT